MDEYKKIYCVKNILYEISAMNLDDAHNMINIYYHIVKELVPYSFPSRQSVGAYKLKAIREHFRKRTFCNDRNIKGQVSKLKHYQPLNNI